jgi:hypothetical protein
MAWWQYGDGGKRGLSLIAALGVMACAGCGGRQPAQSQDPRARGDEWLRKTSDTLAQARTIRVHTAELHDRVRRNGQKLQVEFTRDVLVRRPDRLKVHETGAERDFTVWYNGHTLTVVGARQHIYARADVPATLDEMFDYVADRYDLPMPMADLLYSSPKDALVAESTAGGWVKQTQVEGRSCEELTYHEEAVDFTLWVSSAAPVLPCRLFITYRKKAGQPSSHLTFGNWTLSADAIPDDQFAAVIPAGYEEIPIVERIPKTELRPSATAGSRPASTPKP